MEESAGYIPADVFRSLATDAPRCALFTTYTFSPGVFQQHYLTPLLQQGCCDIVVMADRIGYAQSIFAAASVQGIGTDYRLRQISSRGAFHGKLVLVRTRSSMILGIGSGNLTSSGLQTNAEVGGLYVIDDPGTLKQLDVLQQRLQGMASPGASDSEVLTPIRLAEGTRLLTSLDRSLYDQIEFPESVRRIEIVSPFVDAALDALRMLRELWPQARVCLRVDPGFGALNESLLSAAGGNIDVLVPIDGNGDKGRRRPQVHGKLICLIGDHEATVILGSANLSRPALLSTDNFEAVIERRCSLEHVEALLMVPQIEWRPVQSSDRHHFAFESAPQAARQLMATLIHRELNLSWSGADTDRGVLAIWLRGSCVHEQRLEKVDTDGLNCLSTLLLAEDVRDALAGSCYADLRLENGAVYRGWIEITDFLNLPPESKRQFAVLDDIASAPGSCNEDEVIKFIELLQRNLSSTSRSAWYLTAHERSKDVSVYDDAPIPRSQLLESTQWGLELGPGLLAGLLNRTLDGAIRDLRFFNRDGGGKSSPMHDVVTPVDHLEDRGSARTSVRLPPSVEAVIGELFRQLSGAIDASPSASNLCALISQIPTCVKALAVVIERWMPYCRDRDVAHQYMHRVAIACLAPGSASSLERQGAVLRLITTPLNDLGTRREVRLGVALLEAYILLESKSQRAVRKDVLRDMYDVLRRLLSVDVQELSEAGTELWRLQAKSPDAMPALAELRKEFEAVPGELASLRACRKALRELINVLKRGVRAEEVIQDLIIQACGHDPKAEKAKALRSLVETTAGSPQLVEIDSGELACPACYKTLPISAHNRLRDSTVVHRCSCGRLLTRSLER